MKYSKTCLYCGKEYFVTKKRLLISKFCSYQCNGKSHGGRQTVGEIRKCNNCEKEYYATKSRLSTSRFCSIRCRSIKNGYKVPQTRRYNRAYVFRAKPKRCEICGYDKHAEALDIHHVDEDYKNNMLMNLIVLCCNCHRLLHRGLVKYEAPKLFMNIFPIKVIPIQAVQGLIQQAGAKA